MARSYVMIARVQEVVIISGADERSYNILIETRCPRLEQMVTQKVVMACVEGDLDNSRGVRGRVYQMYLNYLELYRELECYGHRDVRGQDTASLLRTSISVHTYYGGLESSRGEVHGYTGCRDIGSG
ncbi:hypothetical protein CHS0354_042858 [Potamilus streckersoni]|uniref:Uncharacterized protein n=1 Tax=Potamilus streckersoni TaxID=2493646 RepID=A0AAE0T5V7_9BIVA|nr:hypothetical protein CHS0354_042858 [Potamilus streckersoni]